MCEVVVLPFVPVMPMTLSFFTRTIKQLSRKVTHGRSNVVHDHLNQVDFKAPFNEQCDCPIVLCDLGKIVTIGVFTNNATKN